MEIKPGVATAVSHDQILGYLRKSDKLNTLYTGPEWLSVGWGKFTAAAEAEFNEFLSEMTEDWKWYSAKPKFNRNKALYELVDWFLFTASAFHCTLGPEGLDGIEELLLTERRAPRPADFSGNCVDMGDVVLLKCQLVSAQLAVANPATRIAHLASFIETALVYLGATAEQFDIAYHVKYKLCIARVEGGIMTGGTYRKDDEFYPEILK